MVVEIEMAEKCSVNNLGDTVRNLGFVTMASQTKSAFPTAAEKSSIGRLIRQGCPERSFSEAATS